MREAFLGATGSAAREVEAAPATPPGRDSGLARAACLDRGGLLANFRVLRASWTEPGLWRREPLLMNGLRFTSE